MAKRGELWDCGWGEYFGDVDRWSNSTLSTYITDGPQAAWARMTGAVKPDTTEALDFGRALHCGMFEPEEFASRFVAKTWDARRKEGKERQAEVEASGATILKRDAFETVGAMIQALADEAVIRAERGDTELVDMLSAPGLVEQAARWVCAETGLPLRCRWDKAIPDCDRILDVKTTISWQPNDWAKHAVRYGYHRQAWLYSDAFEAVYGRRPRFLFLVMHKKPPYEVALYELDDQALELGMTQCQRAAREILERLGSGDWRHPCQKGVHPITFEPWVYMEDEVRSGDGGPLKLKIGGQEVRA